MVVVQGENFWSQFVKDSFDNVKQLNYNVYEANIEFSNMYVAAFAHPSAGPPKNWGANDRTPYLLNTVKPSLNWLRKDGLGLV